MSDTNNFKEFNSIFNKKGFFKIDKFFDEKTIKEIKLDLNKIINLKPKEIFFYKDRNDLLRRIERFANYSETFKKVDLEIKKFLYLTFNKKFCLFKDKCNFKPSFGEGFYPHYDGIFKWIDKNGKNRNGWYDYANEFFNVLVVLDDFLEENGPLEISQMHNGNFESLLEKTKLNGTPDLNEEEYLKCNFEKMICKSGSIIVFSNKCPHKSQKNNTDKDRGSLYYTYNPVKFGDHYDKYFIDKSSSQNTQSKSLSGQK